MSNQNAFQLSFFKKFNYLIAGLFFVMMIFACKPKQAVTTPLPPEKKAPQIEVANSEKPQHEEAIEPPAVELNVGVSLLMPFDFENNLKEDTNDISKQRLSPNSLQWIEFYEGAKIAADSFNSPKALVNFDLFDSEIDSGLLATYVSGIKIYNNKLVIAEGPNWCKKLVCKNAGKNKSIVVLPNANGEVFQNTIQLTANNDLMIEEMASWLAKHFQSHNISIVYSDNKREEEIAKLFASRIDSMRSNVVKCKTVNFTKVKADGLLKSLDDKRKNLVVITSSNEAFVSPLINILKDKADDDQITLCGLPTWVNFETIDIHSLEKLNTLIFSAHWIDYSNVELAAFRKKFIRTYKTDPQPSAYVGFYFTKGLIESLAAKGLLALDNIAEENNYYNQTLFLFKKQTKINSVTNHQISVLKYQDFNLVKQN